MEKMKLANEKEMAKQKAKEVHLLEYVTARCRGCMCNNISQVAGCRLIPHGVQTVSSFYPSQPDLVNSDNLPNITPLCPRPISNDRPDISAATSSSHQQWQSTKHHPCHSGDHVLCFAPCVVTPLPAQVQKKSENQHKLVEQAETIKIQKGHMHQVRVANIKSSPK